MVKIEVARPVKGGADDDGFLRLIGELNVGVHKLSRVRFRIPGRRRRRRYMEQWEFTSDDGRFEMRFAEIAISPPALIRRFRFFTAFQAGIGLLPPVWWTE